MAPLRITFRLLTPVCIGAPYVYLDGLLAHLAYRRLLGPDYYLLPTKKVQSGPTGMLREVLASYRDVLCCSASIFLPEGLHYQTLTYFKRFEARHVKGLRKQKVDLGHGLLRAWALKAVYLPANEAVFYVLGNPDRIRDLLGDVVALGNDARVGWGWLSGPPEVVEIDEDRSLVWQGRAMRPIPIRYLRSWSDAVMMSYKPPYWAPENVDLCAPPGAEVDDYLRLNRVLPVEVDGPALVEKLRSLSPAQLLVLAVRVRQFWARAERETAPEE